VLSLGGRYWAQAEQEFATAWERDPSCYAACYNLVMTHLSLGQLGAAMSVLPHAVELAPDVEAGLRWRFLLAVIRAARACDKDTQPVPVLADMSSGQEDSLIGLIRDLGHLDTAVNLLQALARARPASPTARRAQVEVLLLKCRQLLDRCDWAGAQKMLL